MQNLVFLFFVANFHFQLNMLCWCEWGISENEKERYIDCSEPFHSSTQTSMIPFKGQE